MPPFEARPELPGPQTRTRQPALSTVPNRKEKQMPLAGCASFFWYLILDGRNLLCFVILVVMQSAWRGMHFLEILRCARLSGGGPPASGWPVRVNGALFGASRRSGSHLTKEVPPPAPETQRPTSSLNTTTPTLPSICHPSSFPHTASRRPLLALRLLCTRFSVTSSLITVLFPTGSRRLRSYLVLGSSSRTPCSSNSQPRHRPGPLSFSHSFAHLCDNISVLIFRHFIDYFV